VGGILDLNATKPGNLLAENLNLSTNYYSSSSSSSSSSSTTSCSLLIGCVLACDLVDFLQGIFLGII
jgi:hypothetical protein